MGGCSGPSGAFFCLGKGCAGALPVCNTLPRGTPSGSQPRWGG